MKIYNEIIFDIDNNVIYEDSFEYTGNLILCAADPGNGNGNDGGGGNGTDEGGSPPGYTSPSLGADEDIQTKPLPSLPSVSNIGVIAPSGVINWNAISGGFQPLPQTGGAKKKLYQLSQFHGGLNRKSSPRDIADIECQDAQNITFSRIGKIMILGDLKSNEYPDGSSTTTIAGISSGHAPSPGYGIYIFKSGYTLADPPVSEVCRISASSDGRFIEVADNATAPSTISDAIAISQFGADIHVAPVFYGANNGLYVCDANFAHTAERQCMMLVHREDQVGTVSDWVIGDTLLDSPIYDDDVASGMGAQDVKVKQADEDASEAGSMIVSCVPTGSSGDGSWGTAGGVNYYFYVSWLFDGGTETGLTSAGDDDGSNSNSDGIAFTNHQLGFNVSLSHTTDNPLGGNKRIEGARVYFKKVGTSERFLLAEISLADGVKGALDSSFTSWDITSDVHTLTSSIVFDAPPSVYTYAAKNGYLANEVYTKSPDINADGAAGPTPHDVRYKTSVVGQNGVVFIGNVRFKSKHTPDGMMYSMPGRPGLFPQYNFFDSPSSDGSPITALAAFEDTILQFRENAMYVINITSEPYYAETIFRDCGVANPCQVFTAEFGVIFANRNGCFIYDGRKVISLTGGKFNISGNLANSWDISEGSVVEAIAGSAKNAVNVPCVGYDPRTQSIIVLKDIGDDSTNNNAWVYNMMTQSWTEGYNFISNGNDIRHTNFLIDTEGYLTIAQSEVQALKIYDIGEASDDEQDIIYFTKDIDFGFPSQTKKVMKVYITYKGDCNTMALYFYVNGASANKQFNTDNTPLLDVGTTTTIATLIPTNLSEATGIYSFALYMTGTVGKDFEINDISILYRLRPIK